MTLADAIAATEKSQIAVLTEDANKTATATAVTTAAAKLTAAQADDTAEAAKVAQVAAGANADLDALIAAATAAKRP